MHRIVDAQLSITSFEGTKFYRLRYVVAIFFMFIFFFFSSRRRHTRLVSDWSSDVCSSDLGSSQTASADANATGGGLVGYGAAHSTANADGHVNAYVAGDVIGASNAAGANSVNISASSANRAVATSSAASGGLFADSQNQAIAP